MADGDGKPKPQRIEPTLPTFDGGGEGKPTANDFFFIAQPKPRPADEAKGRGRGRLTKGRGRKTKARKRRTRHGA